MTDFRYQGDAVIGGEPGGGRASVYYLLDASLDGTAGTADVKADIRDVLLPAGVRRPLAAPR